MKKKKVLRKVLWNVFWIMYWISIGVLIVTLILGGNNTLTNIALIMNFVLILYHVLYHVLRRKQHKERFDAYKELFQCLKFAHGSRYRCYLNARKGEAEEYSKLINMCVNLLLGVGKSMKDDAILTQKEREEVKDIMNKTRVLATRIVPFA